MAFQASDSLKPVREEYLRNSDQVWQRPINEQCDVNIKVVDRLSDFSIGSFCAGNRSDDQMEISPETAHESGFRTKPLISSTPLIKQDRVIVLKEADVRSDSGNASSVASNEVKPIDFGSSFKPHYVNQNRYEIVNLSNVHSNNDATLCAVGDCKDSVRNKSTESINNGQTAVDSQIYNVLPLVDNKLDSFRRPGAVVYDNKDSSNTRLVLDNNVQVNTLSPHSDNSKNYIRKLGMFNDVTRDESIVSELSSDTGYTKELIAENIIREDRIVIGSDDDSSLDDASHLQQSHTRKKITDSSDLYNNSRPALPNKFQYLQSNTVGCNNAGSQLQSDGNRANFPLDIQSSTTVSPDSKLSENVIAILRKYGHDVHSTDEHEDNPSKTSTSSVVEYAAVRGDVEGKGMSKVLPDDSALVEKLSEADDVSSSNDSLAQRIRTLLSSLDEKLDGDITKVVSQGSLLGRPTMVDYRLLEKDLDDIEQDLSYLRDNKKNFMDSSNLYNMQHSVDHVSRTPDTDEQLEEDHIVEENQLLKGSDVMNKSDSDVSDISSHILHSPPYRSSMGELNLRKVSAYSKPGYETINSIKYLAASLETLKGRHGAVLANDGLSRGEASKSFSTSKLSFDSNSVSGSFSGLKTNVADNESVHKSNADSVHSAAAYNIVNSSDNTTPVCSANSELSKEEAEVLTTVTNSRPVGGMQGAVWADKVEKRSDTRTVSRVEPSLKVIDGRDDVSVASENSCHVKQLSRLQPYIPGSSSVVYYVDDESPVEDEDQDKTDREPDYDLSQTTIESSHTGSVDARGPQFSRDMLGSRLYAPMDIRCGGVTGDEDTRLGVTGGMTGGVTGCENIRSGVAGGVTGGENIRLGVTGGMTDGEDIRNGVTTDRSDTRITMTMTRGAGDGQYSGFNDQQSRVSNLEHSATLKKLTTNRGQQSMAGSKADVIVANRLDALPAYNDFTAFGTPRVHSSSVKHGASATINTQSVRTTTSTTASTAAAAVGDVLDQGRVSEMFKAREIIREEREDTDKRTAVGDNAVKFKSSRAVDSVYKADSDSVTDREISGDESGMLGDRIRSAINLSGRRVNHLVHLSRSTDELGRKIVERCRQGGLTSSGLVNHSGSLTQPLLDRSATVSFIQSPVIRSVIYSSSSTQVTQSSLTQPSHVRSTTRGNLSSFTQTPRVRTAAGETKAGSSDDKDHKDGGGDGNRSDRNAGSGDAGVSGGGSGAGNVTRRSLRLGRQNDGSSSESDRDQSRESKRLPADLIADVKQQNKHSNDKKSERKDLEENWKESSDSLASTSTDASLYRRHILTDKNLMRLHEKIARQRERYLLACIHRQKHKQRVITMEKRLKDKLLLRHGVRADRKSGIGKHYDVQRDHDRELSNVDTASEYNQVSDHTSQSTLTDSYRDDIDDVIHNAHCAAATRTTVHENDDTNALCSCTVDHEEENKENEIPGVTSLSAQRSASVRDYDQMLSELRRRERMRPDHKHHMRTRGRGVQTTPTLEALRTGEIRPESTLVTHQYLKSNKSAGITCINKSIQTKPEPVSWFLPLRDGRDERGGIESRRADDVLNRTIEMSTDSHIEQQSVISLQEAFEYHMQEFVTLSRRRQQHIDRIRQSRKWRNRDIDGVEHSTQSYHNTDIMWKSKKGISKKNSTSNSEKKIKVSRGWTGLGSYAAEKKRKEDTIRANKKRAAVYAKRVLDNLLNKK